MLQLTIQSPDLNNIHHSWVMNEAGGIVQKEEVTYQISTHQHIHPIPQVDFYSHIYPQDSCVAAWLV